MSDGGMSMEISCTGIPFFDPIYFPSLLLVALLLFQEGDQFYTHTLSEVPFRKCKIPEGFNCVQQIEDQLIVADCIQKTWSPCIPYLQSFSDILEFCCKGFGQISYRLLAIPSLQQY